MKKIIFFLILVLSNSLLLANWQLTGPGYSSVSSVFIDGNDLYVGAAGRIYLSENKGNSFMPLFDYGSKQFDYIFDVINNDNKIFVGTLKGLYTSTDNGKNWELDTINGKVSIIWDMKKKGNDIFVLSGGQLYLSSDNGKNWELVTPADWIAGRVLTIDGNNLYVGGAGLINKPYLWISHDYGGSWKRLEDTLTGLKTEDIISIAASGNNVYIGTNDYGFYISRDKGEHWEKSESFYLNFSPVYSLLCLGDTVFAGNEDGFYISTDNGQNWINTNFNYPARDIAFNNGEIYLASEGVGVSTDYGKSWELKQRGLGSTLINDIEYYNKTIYAATYDKGVYVSYDDSKTWKQFNGIENYEKIIKIAFLDSSIFKTSYFNGYLEYSNDFGKTWKSAIDLNGKEIVNIKCIAVDKEKKNVFAGSGENGLYVSSDFGKNWQSLTKDDLQHLNVRYIFLDNNKIYLAEHQWGIYISSDNGVEWKNFYIENGLPSNVYFIALTVCNGNIVLGTYASKNDEIKGLYLSKDNGESWLQVGDSATIRNILYLTSYNNYIFAGTDKGILLSSDCGGNWFRPENSLSTLKIYKLLIVGSNIYAATNEGVFKDDLNDFGITYVENANINEIKDYLYSHLPYPIPAKAMVNTKVYFDSKTDITNDDISVVDIYGIKISSKKDISINKLSKVSCILTWNCSGVPNGIYFILINHGTEKRAVKLMVRK